MTHRPGPYRVGKLPVSPREWRSIVCDTPHPLTREPERDVEYYGGHLVAESVRAEDAPLLAAAPELLDVAEAALTWWHSIPSHIEKTEPEWVEQARQVIAKAKGQA